jgi:hypothetical protein
VSPAQGKGHKGLSQTEDWEGRKRGVGKERREREREERERGKGKQRRGKKKEKREREKRERESSEITDTLSLFFSPSLSLFL